MVTTDKIKILILDDEQQFTEELSGFFEDDYITYEANNVGDGRRILKEKDIDLLILDVRLPGISGLDILKEVKEQFPNIEVIVISAHGDMDTVIKALRLGAFDYLRKPFRFIDLQVLSNALKNSLRCKKLKQMEERNCLYPRLWRKKSTVIL